ncbi:MAG: carbon storage regulator [Pirellulales bacterium]
MLVLTRKAGENIRIGDNIIITVLRTSGGRVRLGIEAPRGISIRRDELLIKNRQAATAASRILYRSTAC